MNLMMWPTYTVKVEIRDVQQPVHAPGVIGGQIWAGGADAAMQQVGGSTGHRFYGGYTGASGCDAALEAVRKALKDAGIPATVTLERFEHKA